MELVGFLEECERGENKGMKENIQLLEDDTVDEYVPKIWNCGVWKGRPGRMTVNTCFIHHGYGGSKKGCTRERDVRNFKEHAKKGDVIFTHSTTKGGLTHFGYFTGGFISKKIDPAEDTRMGIYTHIYVHKWFTLPKVVKGTGMNRTLYEVKPQYKNGKETKNYQNYSTHF